MRLPPQRGPRTVLCRAAWFRGARRGFDETWLATPWRNFGALLTGNSASAFQIDRQCSERKTQGIEGIAVTDRSGVDADDGCLPPSFGILMREQPADGPRNGVTFGGYSGVE